MLKKETIIQWADYYIVILFVPKMQHNINGPKMYVKSIFKDTEHK